MAKVPKTPRTLYPGDNGSHVFYETEHEPKTLIIRNGDEPWICLELDGRMSPTDTARQRKAGPNEQHVISGASLSKVLATIEAQYGIVLRITGARTWQGGRGRRMHLSATN